MAWRAVWQFDADVLPALYTVQFQEKHNPLGVEGGDSWTTRHQCSFANSRGAEKASARWIRKGELDLLEAVPGSYSHPRDAAPASVGSSSSAKPGAE